MLTIRTETPMTVHMMASGALDHLFDGTIQQVKHQRLGAWPTGKHDRLIQTLWVLGQTMATKTTAGRVQLSTPLAIDNPAGKIAVFAIAFGTDPGFGAGDD
ncbi:hypothetical protein Q4595_22845, partial [Wenyingzhuangia sp. 1_MG-2023]|nr:hypothetical protein [Wenyingzhuangia sp. 1_MG-2023]